MTKYVFVTGSGHSGSTLIDLILGTHSKIFSIGEIKQFEKYISENKVCSCETTVLKCTFWNKVRSTILETHGTDIFTHPDRFRFYLQSENKSASKLRYWSLITLATFNNIFPAKLINKFKDESKVVQNVYTLYDKVRAISNRQIVVDSSKSPLLMKLLWMKKPEEFKVIYIVRDGRAVVASNIRKNKKLLFAVKGWVKNYRLVKLLTRNMNANNVLQVKYENICNNTESEIRRICNFIDVPFEREMLFFRTREIHNIDGNRMRFSKDNIIKLDERWRRELNNNALAVFNKYAKKINEHLGYK